MREMFEQPIIIEYLVGFIEYRPWESSAPNETYELACQLGRVPRIGNVELIREDIDNPPRIIRIEKSVEISPSGTLNDSLTNIESQLSTRQGKLEYHIGLASRPGNEEAARQ